MDDVFQSEVDSAINVLKNKLPSSSGSTKKSLGTALAVLEGATIVDDPEPDFTDRNAWAKEVALAVRTGVDRCDIRRVKSLAELKALREAWISSVPGGQAERMLAFRYTSDADPYVR